MFHSSILRRLPFGLAAALTLTLAACASPSTDAAVTVTQTASSASSSPAASTSAAGSTSVAAPSASASASSAPTTSSPKKPVALKWTTIKRKSGPRSARHAEKLEVPYLDNADKQVSDDFDAAVSKEVASWRDEVQPMEDADCDKVAKCPYMVDKLSGGTYQGRYASALIGVHPWTGGVHHLGSPFGLTIDVKTGDFVSLDTFLTVSDDEVNRAIVRALRQELPQNEAANLDTVPSPRDEGVAWSVSDEGVSFAFTEGMVASNAQSVVSVTVPWDEVRS